ncbi:MAG: SpoIIE family protein phosphatase, partial [Gemmatimonadetes bacterium]|nr:SpoIIE family protein phosphatase [Gemmatimonadota bacterium]
MSQRDRFHLLGLLLALTALQAAHAEPASGRTIVAGPGVRQGVWHVYDRPDGFASPVRAMHQDGSGHIWMATIAGLSRYDGHSLTYYTKADGLPYDEVYTIAADRAGDLWIGTGETGGTGGGGVSRFDGETFHNLSTADGLVHDRVVAIMEDRSGHMWFGTNGGISRLDPSGGLTSYTVKEGLVPGRVRALAEDAEGNLWIGTWGGGLSRFDGETFTTFGTTDGLAAAEIRCIYLDRSGNLWIGTVGGLSLYADGAFRSFTTADGLAENQVLSILEDARGVLWLGTAGAGYTRYDGKTFSAFRGEDGYAPSWTLSLLEDFEGNMWFGTWNGGLARYFGMHFTSYDDYDNDDTDDGLGKSLVAVHSAALDDQGHMWFATWGRGVSLWNGDVFEAITERDGLADNHIVSVLADREGDLWFGSHGQGVSRYDGSGFITYTTTDGLGSDYIEDLLEDRHGHMWFAMSGPFADGGGLTRYDGEHFTTFTQVDGLVHDNVTALAEDADGHLWIGTTHGVSLFDGESFQTVDLEGLTSAYINHILVDSQGRQWFATRKQGVHRFGDGEAWHLHQSDGLASETVRSIFEDRAGHFWFATDGGLNRYDGLVVQTLLRRDGLAGNKISDIVEDVDGALWVCTDKGITRILPPPSTQPAIQLLSLTADRKYGPQSQLRLTSTDDYLAFELQGLSYRTRADQLVYVHRLLGHQNQWRSSDQGRIEYQDLPIGDYTFEAQVADRDLAYSDPISVNVRIDPPYREIGLLTLLGIAGLGLVLAVHTAARRRRERDQAREQLLHELEGEMQVARDLQMGLMPDGPPKLAGFSLAGRCLPAQQVSGDLFRYFVQDDVLTVALADVTGKAMEAAIPVVMFNGILDSHVDLGGAVGELYERLNRALFRALDKRTFICLSMVKVALSSRRLT